MKRNLLLETTALLSVGFFLVTISKAHASYIDIGTTSYLFQMAAAGLVGGIIAMRRFWWKWRVPGKSRKESR